MRKPYYFMYFPKKKKFEYKSWNEEKYREKGERGVS